MIGELLHEIRNYFDKSRHFGTFRIVDGSPIFNEREIPIQTGQYFRICGSVFNDGVYQYPYTELRDEEWTGAIWLLAIPQEVIDLSNDIDKWNDAYGATGPYTSESFAGYSYTKATSKNGGKYTWKDEFASQLKRWRKICPY